MTDYATSGSWPDPPSMLNVETFRSEAEDFAERLTGLLNGTVTTGARVTVFVHEGGELATVAPGASQRRPDVELIPLNTSRNEVDRQDAALWLKLFYVVEPDREREHLAVRTSMFGLCVSPDTQFCPI